MAGEEIQFGKKDRGQKRKGDIVVKRVSVIIKERQVKFKTNRMRALRNKAKKKKGWGG